MRMLVMIHIAVAVVLLVIVLLLDWRKDKKLFLHVAKPVELIRSENKDQVDRREQREQEVVYIPKKGSQKGIVKDQVAQRERFEAERKNVAANGFEVKPLNIPSTFLQAENIQPKPKNTNYPMPQLRSTHTGGYTVVPQRPAPPPPGGRQ